MHEGRVSSPKLCFKARIYGIMHYALLIGNGVEMAINFIEIID
jgi:hypothetical protein